MTVEIVQCKDCIHRPKYDPPDSTDRDDICLPIDSGGWTDCSCPYVCDDPWYTIVPKDTWWCHKGEKKHG